MGGIVQRKIREINRFAGELRSETNSEHRPGLKIARARGGRARGLDVEQLLIPRGDFIVNERASAAYEKLPIIAMRKVHVTDVGIDPPLPNLKKLKIVDDPDVRGIEAFSRASLEKRFRGRRGSVLVRRSALSESCDRAAQAKQCRIDRCTQE